MSESFETRLASVMTAATSSLGSTWAAERWLHTPNFALGGAAPFDLLGTANGVRLVLAKLQMHVDGAPL
jgi:uncharacterized protein (DUF2384 family)